LQERVRQQVNELEATNRELEAFSYSVSHDLRGPLRAISGFSSILKEDYSPCLPAEASVLLNKVSDNATRMGELIEHLLSFSHISRQQLNMQPVDMTALAQDAIEELKTDIEGRNIAIDIATLPAACGDAVLLRQVFVNLLSNALKFTRNCSTTAIVVGSFEQAQQTVYFVRDNGAGFDMKFAGRLFGVFQRLHAPAEFEGTGIGLSFVQRIVERHGGRIWVEAAPDQGATFYFTLGIKAGEVCGAAAASGPA
jgi:two-component system sensor kinase